MRFLFISCYLLFASSLTFRSGDLVHIARAYEVGPSSVLTVNGKTNVKSFCCLSQEYLGTDTLFYSFSEDPSEISFSETGIKFLVEKLDCGHKMMNRDLCEALQKDEFPHISIDLIKAVNPHCSNLNDCANWTGFTAIVDVTIACTTRSRRIAVQIKNTGPDRFRIVGGIDVKLTDFGISPPVAMLGMIKVKDDLNVEFDLEIILL